MVAFLCVRFVLVVILCTGDCDLCFAFCDRDCASALYFVFCVCACARGCALC